MFDLQQLRNEIDGIDEEIVNLFEKRMEVSSRMADYKISAGKQVYDPEREKVKLQTLKGMAHNEFNAISVEELFEQILSMSRKLQYRSLTEHGIEEDTGFQMVDELPMKDVTVVFQGVRGAYSYAAMRVYFGKDITSYDVRTWRDAMDAIAEGKADYAVLPIENSTAGIVADIYDLMVEYDLYIAGEQIIKCEHCLLGLPGATMDDIQEVYSHPQALAQCKAYLERHSRWKVREVDNTAVAAKKIKEDGIASHAAIASKAAAEVHGLHILREKIYHNEQNSTRFIVVSKHKRYTQNAGKVSICFEQPHESGSLYNMLSHIIYNGLNMTKIESRPIIGRNWQYRFFVDFEGNLSDGAVKNALRGIHEESNSLRIFGNY